MRIKIFFIICLLFLTGCSLSPYENPKYGADSVNAWFLYKKDNLGQKRKEIENISEILETECKFKEKYKENYIFSCTITYSPIGETIIPLSKHESIKVYALFKPNNSTFNYKVYNSKSEDGIWLKDDSL